MKIKKNSKIVKEYGDLIFSKYKNVKNPLADYFENIQKDTGKYLNNQLLLKYSPEQIKTYLEIDAYIKKLIETINKAFDEGVELKWK